MIDKPETQNIRLIIFARYPVAGKAKTRLIPAVGDSGAAKIHKILAHRTINTLYNASLSCDETLAHCKSQAIISYTGGSLDQFEQWIDIDDIYYQRQPEGDLTDRLLACLEPAPVIFFGSDTPDLSENHVKEAMRALMDYDIVIGPALDGGYYLIGMNSPHDILLKDMPWSSDAVLPTTLERCEAMGLKVKMLEPLSDCDMPEDLARWPWLRDAMDDVKL
jgi:rSAM/selenodomain-associated transferase 1